jgi:hypothetical protein
LLRGILIDPELAEVVMRWLLIPSLMMLGCSSNEPPTATPEQLASMERVGSAATSVVQSLHLSDALFKFDPDLDPGKTADGNASTIRSNLDGTSCATVKLSGVAELTADFGAGCSFGGVTVSGTVVVKVTVTGPDSGRTVGVKLTLTSLVVNGWDLAGSASFSSSGGSTLSATLDLTHSGMSVKFDGSVVGSTGSMKIDGALTVNSGAAPLSASLAAVTVARGACWPNGGTATISGLGTLTFDSQTATTGQAKLVIQTPLGPTPPFCYALPSHGTGCNATACPKL